MYPSAERRTHPFLSPQQGGKGFIDKQDLQSVCHQFHLCVSGPVLDDLMDYCDMDRDGLISFVEFANFLSWKDMMPISSQEERLLTKGQRGGGRFPGVRTSSRVHRSNHGLPGDAELV